MEQTLGAEVTLAALANRSATLVPILVHAYTNSLKQTLSSVQSEMRSAQQVVVDSVSALSQQLTTFNDSTVIGDSFVRYETSALGDAGGILDCAYLTFFCFYQRMAIISIKHNQDHNEIYENIFK